MQWGPSFTTSNWEFLISLAVLDPDALIGTMRSASPWMTKVGTSTQARSLRKSSSQVATQAKLAVEELPAAIFQLARITSSEIRFPISRSAL